MSKKLIGIIIVIICIVIGCILYFVLSNRTSENSSSNNTDNTNENNENQISETALGDNILVVYFSAQNHTEAVAEKIASNLDADIFEIIPVDEYTSEDLDWTDDNSRVSREHEDESLRDVELQSTEVSNWDSYDTVLIGYPIWWGVAACPVNTFVEANDFSGKTVIPFCTSASSGLGQSGELLAEAAGTGNWSEGYRFRSNPTDSDIEEFINSLT